MDNMKDMILEAVEMNGIENVVMPLMNEIFLSFTDIAGTRYCDNQDVFKKLEKNDPLLLKREADNKYDSNAIKVLTMDAGKIIHARVYSCYKENYDPWYVSIKICMIDF